MAGLHPRSVDPVEHSWLPLVFALSGSLKNTWWKPTWRLFRAAIDNFDLTRCLNMKWRNSVYRMLDEHNVWRMPTPQHCLVALGAVAFYELLRGKGKVWHNNTLDKLITRKFRSNASPIATMKVSKGQHWKWYLRMVANIWTCSSR